MAPRVPLLPSTERDLNSLKKVLWSRRLVFDSSELLFSSCCLLISLNFVHVVVCLSSAHWSSSPWSLLVLCFADVLDGESRLYLFIIFFL